MFSIRGMSPDDYEAVHALDIDIQREYRGRAWEALNEEEKSSFLWLQPSHFAPDADTNFFLVAVDAEEVIGFIFATRERVSSRIYVEGVAVSSRHRKQGVGTALYAELMRRATAAGVRHIRTTINPDNEPSQRLHKAAGFTLNPWIEARAELGS